jgi:hypothetical protein
MSNSSTSSPKKNSKWTPEYEKEYKRQYYLDHKDEISLRNSLRRETKKKERAEALYQKQDPFVGWEDVRLSTRSNTICRMIFGWPKK